MVVAFAYQPLATLAVAWILAVSYGWGKLARERLALEIESPASDLGLSIATGLGLLVCVLFVAGLAGGLRVGVLAALLTAGSVVARRQIAALPATLRAMHARWRQSLNEADALLSLFVPAAVVLLGCGLMVALAPTVTFDSLRTHLPAAQYYAQQHALRPVPGIDYTYYPQGFELLMTLAFALAGQPGAQILAAAMFALLLLLGWSIARECGAGHAGAAIGVVLAGSVPFLHWTAVNPKNDVPLAAFQLGALLAYLHARRTGCFRWTLVAAFLLASSFGVKHVALFGAVPLGLLFVRSAIAARTPVRALAALALVLVVFGTFWHVRTFVLTGNLVYPSVSRVPLETAAFDPEFSLEAKLKKYLVWPWSIHFDGIPSFESVSSNPMGIALVVLAPLFLLVRGPAGAVWPVVFYCAFSLFYWVGYWPVLRYAIAPLTVLLVLAGPRLVALYEGSGVVMRASLLAACAHVLLFALCLTLILEVNAPQFQYFARRIDRDRYLREVLPPTAPLLFLRGRAGPDDGILAVDACPDAYAPHPGRLS
ncbi:MAG: glycosyltransferase family 39 protein, partial [Bryobacteraceae bacterium]